MKSLFVDILVMIHYYIIIIIIIIKVILMKTGFRLCNVLKTSRANCLIE